MGPNELHAGSEGAGSRDPVTLRAAATAARRLCRCLFRGKTTKEEQARLAVGCRKVQVHLGLVLSKGPGHCEVEKFVKLPRAQG